MFLKDFKEVQEKLKFQIDQLFDAKAILQGASLMQVSDMDLGDDGTGAGPGAVASAGTGTKAKGTAPKKSLNGQLSDLTNIANALA